ncbi:MAG: hypothetical protein FWD57_02575 [Polyangiaceae bacterium]|nr:hypothetical protein [Polyangiaceae bacterium]
MGVVGSSAIWLSACFLADSINSEAITKLSLDGPDRDKQADKEKALCRDPRSSVGKHLISFLSIVLDNTKACPFMFYCST